jgi:uncharacterized UPF0146 family protein
MSFSSVQEWIAWIGVIIPLGTLAWAAYQYVALQKRSERQQRFDNLFIVMDKIGEANASLPAQVAAIYELRSYPEYAEVIIRFCNDATSYIHGGSAELLKTELRLTAAFFENGHK